MRHEDSDESGSEASMEMEKEENMCTEEYDKRPNKRNREGDREEEWHTVGRKDKRFAKADVGKPTPEDRFEVCMTSLEQLPKQFKLAKLLQTEKVQNVTRIKYLNSYKVIIQFSKEDSAEELINSKIIKDMGLNTYKTMEANHAYGVIKDMDLDYSDEEILESISSDIQILSISRLKRRNKANGQWESSEKMRLRFKGSSLPAYIKIFGVIVEVTPYIYPVTQCARCWRFGHSTKFCPSHKIICPKCGQDHPNCHKTIYKCNNCGGKHMAMASICPLRVKEKKIRELMSEFGVSYKKALTLYVPPSPPPQKEPTFTEEDFPSTFNEKQDETNRPDPSAGKKSYAEASKTKRRNESKKKNTKQTGFQEDIEFDEGSDTSEKGTNEQDKKQGTGAKTTRKDEMTWMKLLKKLKEKICESREGLTWEEKIKECWTILYKSIKSIIVQYLSDWPYFSFLHFNAPD